MHELLVERSRFHNTLYLNVWCRDTGNIHTEWPICFLHNSEVDFLRGMNGGRFRFYAPDLRTNKVPLRIGLDTRIKTLGEMLDWIGEHILSDWSFDIEPDEPVSLGGPFGLRTTAYTLNLYFEDADEAVLMKLKFA